MTPNSQSAIVICFGGRAPRALLLGSIAMLLGGCVAAKKRPAIPWQTAAIVRPIIPPLQSVGDSTLPDVTSIPERAPVSPRITFPSAHPPPPRSRAASQPVQTNENDKQPDGPLIVPQITAQESATAQQEINASLSAAERNLEAVRGKKLNAAQSDVSSKVKGFMNDAREAARSGDWTRARSLAKKAEVLSEELARSL
jgi:hypothetical protein